MLKGDDLGGRAFALFLRPHPGEFAHFSVFKKNANSRGLAGGEWVLLELSDALEECMISLVSLAAVIWVVTAAKQPGGDTWVKFCWVCAAGLFCGQL